MQSPDNYKFTNKYMSRCASEIIDRLIPTFQEIAVAGSIRRKKELVKDIEIVIAPQDQKDLTGYVYKNVAMIIDRLHELRINGQLDPGKGGERYRQFIWYGSGPDPKGYFPTVDLFIVHPPATWGVTMALRTGPAEFSRLLVTQRNKGGLLPSYLNVKGGALLCNGTKVPTPTEKIFFEEIRIPWIEPEDRHRDNIKDRITSLQIRKQL